jgi:carboxypeptidase Taq
MTAYQRLTEQFARIATLNEAASMLGWDAAAMMPVGGGAARGEQMATLAGLSHELLTAPAIADDLAAAEPAHDDWQAQNLKLMREAHQRATALPRRLVEASSLATSKCEMLWREARPASDFPAVRAALEEVFALTREAAGILGETLGLSPYDALMSQYQRGVGAADVTPVFAT